MGAGGIAKVSFEAVMAKAKFPEAKSALGVSIMTAAVGPVPGIESSSGKHTHCLLEVSSLWESSLRHVK